MLEQDAYIIDLHNKEMTQREIADMIHMSQGYVCIQLNRLIAEGHIQPRERCRGKRSVYSKEDMIIKLYNEMHTYRYISHKIGYSVTSIQKIVNELVEKGILYKRRRQYYDEEFINGGK